MYKSRTAEGLAGMIRSAVLKKLSSIPILARHDEIYAETVRSSGGNDRKNWVSSA